MRPNWYALISKAVEEGAEFGVYRAFEHNKNPDRADIVKRIKREIMNQLTRAVLWDDLCEEGSTQLANIEDRLREIAKLLGSNPYG